MRRRAFITLIGSAAAAWPVTARAQQPVLPVVGYLDQYSAEPTGMFLAAFRKGLDEIGYVEGRNVTIEFRYANNQNNRLRELVADLTQRRVAVIVTPFDRTELLATARTAKQQREEKATSIRMKRLRR
jgi:putative tryptophan/tyrosine transport system substrate-binding protein